MSHLIWMYTTEEIIAEMRSNIASFAKPSTCYHLRLPMSCDWRQPIFHLFTPYSFLVASWCKGYYSSLGMGCHQTTVEQNFHVTKVVLLRCHLADETGGAARAKMRHQELTNRHGKYKNRQYGWFCSYLHWKELHALTLCNGGVGIETK